MPRNQSSTQTTATGAATARVAKPRTPRVSTSKHSKAVSAEAVTVMSHQQPHEELEEIIASLTTPAENPLEAISAIAYGYWEMRGGQGGDPLEDWVRAEEEYRRRLAAL